MNKYLIRELRNISVWHGNYRGVTFEINNWQNTYEKAYRKDNWAFYLYISLDRIPNQELAEQLWLPPEKDEKGRVHYKEYDSWLPNLDWHCGITWYSKESGLDGAERIIKAGCDYGHYWDEGREYSLDFVTYEVKKCIDSFKTIVPEYKWHCSMVGGYWLPSEGILSEDEVNFISNDGIKYAEKSRPENKNGWWHK